MRGWRRGRLFGVRRSWLQNSDSPGRTDPTSRLRKGQPPNPAAYTHHLRWPITESARTILSSLKRRLRWSEGGAAISAVDRTPQHHALRPCTSSMALQLVTADSMHLSDSGTLLSQNEYQPANGNMQAAVFILAGYGVVTDQSGCWDICALSRLKAVAGRRSAAALTGYDVVRFDLPGCGLRRRHQPLTAILRLAAPFSAVVLWCVPASRCGSGAAGRLVTGRTPVATPVAATLAAPDSGGSGARPATAGQRNRPLSQCTVWNDSPSVGFYAGGHHDFSPPRC
jgi:hypothetical protein